jgi:ABC-type nitrate/sulfonate/bicarbonate transport system substrate-binding protein
MAERSHPLARFALVFLILAILAGAVVASSCSPGHSGLLEPIIIGATPNELNTLVYIADELGYFAGNGVRIEYRDYDTGLAAVGGMLAGEADIALTMEFVIVGGALQRRDVLTLATIDRAMTFYLIARKDKGILSVADLKGKRVGVPRQTIMEFYLGRMLEINGMTIRDVATVDIQVPNTAREISTGNVDAVVAFEPNVTNVSRQLADGAMMWAVQSNQASFWCAVSTRKWVNGHAAAVRNFLKSMAQAEQYVILHGQEAKTRIQNRFHYDDIYIDSVWPRNQFSLSLDQSLIIAMEDQARWMIAHNLPGEKQVPNFLDYLYEDGLKAVKPEAVTIIR